MKQENEVKMLSQEELDKIYEAQVSTYEKLLGSGKYKDLLLKLGMNGCSLNNLLYLLSQNADATVIKNAKDWEKAGRKPLPKATPLKLTAPVREGEKIAMRISRDFMRQRLTIFHRPRERIMCRSVWMKICQMKTND